MTAASVSGAAVLVRLTFKYGSGSVCLRFFGVAFNCRCVKVKGKNKVSFPPSASPDQHSTHTLSILRSAVEQFCQLCGVGVGNDMLTTDVSNES